MLKILKKEKGYRTYSQSNRMEGATHTVDTRRGVIPRAAVHQKAQSQSQCSRIVKLLRCSTLTATYSTRRANSGLKDCKAAIKSKDVFPRGYILLFQCLETDDVYTHPRCNGNKHGTHPPLFGDDECAVEQCCPHHCNRYYLHT